MPPHVSDDALGQHYSFISEQIHHRTNTATHELTHGRALTGRDVTHMGWQTVIVCLLGTSSL